MSNLLSMSKIVFSLLSIQLFDCQLSMPVSVIFHFLIVNVICQNFKNSNLMSFSAKLVDQIMSDGVHKDFTETVWEKCYSLPLDQLAEVLQAVIKSIPEAAQRYFFIVSVKLKIRLSVDDSNTSNLAMRVQAIKRGKRAQVARRLRNCSNLYAYDYSQKWFLDSVKITRICSFFSNSSFE